MTSNPLRVQIPLLVAAMLFMAGNLRGQTQNDKYDINLDIGYRWKIGFDGSEEMYRTQVDLGQGPKLFNGQLFYVPAEGHNGMFDRLEIRFNSWGGEPYNTIEVRANKAEKYDFSFYYQNYHYFSSIPSFANPLFEQGNLLSQHRQDSSIKTSGFQLSFLPGKKISPFIAYRRSDREGVVRTTFSADGDEFKLNSNLDLSSDDLSGGLLFRLSKVTFRTEVGGRWYRDKTDFFSQGFQEGNSSLKPFGRDVVLEDYEGNNDFGSRVMPYTTVNANFRPVRTLSVDGKVSYSISDTRTDFYETMTGNFFSFPMLRAFYEGKDAHVNGMAKAPSIMVDVTARWEPVSWLKVLERFRTRRTHTSGSALARLAFSNVEKVVGHQMTERLDMELPQDRFLALNTDIQELEGQVYVTRGLMLRAGHRYESRELKLDLAYPSTRNVLLAGGAYHFSSRNWVAVDYEFGDTDQPIFRTDPLDYNRLRIKGKLSPFEALEVNGSVTLFDHENDLFDLSSDNRDYSLQFVYTPVSRVTVEAQWSRVDFDFGIPYVIPQDFSGSFFTFRELADYGQVMLSTRLIRNAELTLGYSVWANVGDFPVKDHRPFARLEVPVHEKMSVYGQWGYYDYNEGLQLYPQDYRVHLAILGLKFSLSKQ